MRRDNRGDKRNGKEGKKWKDDEEMGRGKGN